MLGEAAKADCHSPQGTAVPMNSEGMLDLLECWAAPGLTGTRAGAGPALTAAEHGLPCPSLTSVSWPGRAFSGEGHLFSGG